MGHHHHGHAGLRQLLHDLQYLAHHLGVEGGGGLVEQHDLRLHGQRPDDGHALLLSAGQLGGPVVGTVGQAHALQEGHGLLLGLRPGLLLDLAGGHGQVVQHRLVGKQVEVLEHHAHLLAVQGQIHLFAGDVHAVEDDRAGRGLFQQVQASQECALAAAGRPDDGHHVALADVRGHAVQRLDIAAVVVFFQVMHLYECLCHQICTSRCCLCLRS